MTRQVIDRRIAVTAGLILVSGILIILSLAYLGRGWIRGTAFPRVYSFIYEPKIERTLNREAVDQKKAIKELGITSFYKKDQPECYMAEYTKFNIDMDCESSFLVGDAEVSVKDYGEFRAKLEEVLDEMRANGWEVSMDTSLEYLVSSTNVGDHRTNGSVEKHLNKNTLCYTNIDLALRTSSSSVHFEMKCEYRKE